MRLQLNAPFGKIILICSQQLTRHTIHQVSRIPWCASDQQQPVLTSQVLLPSPCELVQQRSPSSAWTGAPLPS